MKVIWDVKKAVIIAEPKLELAAKLHPWLTEKGYQVQVVNDTEVIISALNLKNTISVLLVDDRITDRFACEDIATIKKKFGDVPIIVCTNTNDPEKEKRIRKVGVFYYHIKGAGMNELTTAISCAVKRCLYQQCCG